MTATPDGPGLRDSASLRILNAAFEECEEIIERGLATFVVVGNALLRIRDGRLYRQEYANFETYCQDRWNLSPSRAYQLIDAAYVSTLVEVGNEAQARELAPLLDQPEALRETWERAVEQTDGKPTAAAVRGAREQVAPRPVKVTEPTVDSETWQAQQQDAPVHPLAAARADVARQPAIVAGKGIERLVLVRKTFDAAGSAAQIVADLTDDPELAAGWLAELDRTLPVLTDLAIALRRRNLRSVRS